MITIKKDGVEITVDTINEAMAILNKERTKRKYTKREQPTETKKCYKIAKVGRPRKTGMRHTCQHCGKGFLSQKETAKYCSRTCAGQVNGYKNIMTLHIAKNHNLTPRKEYAPN